MLRHGTVTSFSRLQRALALPLAIIITAALWPTLGSCDALYFQTRVIKRTEPDKYTEFPSFPLSALARYNAYSDGHPNGPGLPTPHAGCDVAARYAATLTALGLPACPPMQQVLYPPQGPNNDAPPDNVLFNSDITASGVNFNVWNLINSQSQPGWVYADGTHFVQFASLTKNVLENPLVNPAGSASIFNDEKVYYWISSDHGLSFNSNELLPLIQSGAQYSGFHPLDPVNLNHNAARTPGTNAIGSGFNSTDVLLPITVTRPDLTTPAITSFTDAYVVRGVWSGTGAATTLSWTLSNPASLPSSLSTRGADEPSVLELDATGRCILVARGSNESNSGFTAGHYWLFQSADGCRTWGTPTIWGYDDGTPFYAPASNCVLFRSPRNGRVYWVGAISASNPEGNWPRTTLVAAEVDLEHLGIIKDTATIVDRMDVANEDTDLLQLNNQQIAVQPPGDGASAGQAFVYWPRQDFGCSNCSHDPTSWYQLGVASGNDATLNVSVDEANLAHSLSWSTTTTDVVRWHLRRRFLSGNPLTDLWEEIGCSQASTGDCSFPATTTSATITGYEPYQEVDYEIVAEKDDGSAETSNRVTVRFPGYAEIRLSFAFPTEPYPSAQPPINSVALRWTYAPVGSGFRLFRRYTRCTQPCTLNTWAAVGDIAADGRTVTLGGYDLTDQFDLYLQSLDGTGYTSNIINVRFPAPAVKDPQGNLIAPAILPY